MQIDPRNSECPRKVLAVLEPGAPGARMLRTYWLGSRFPMPSRFATREVGTHCGLVGSIAPPQHEFRRVET